jgi:hypothetical protein
MIYYVLNNINIKFREYIVLRLIFVRNLRNSREIIQITCYQNAIGKSANKREMSNVLWENFIIIQIENRAHNTKRCVLNV